MRLQKLQSYISEQNVCPVLSNNMIEFFETHEIDFEDGDPITSYNQFYESFFDKQKYKLFDSDQKKLSIKYSIPQELVLSFYELLEEAGGVYILYSMHALNRVELNESLDELRKLSKAAQRLKSLLPVRESSTFALLVMIDQIEKKRNLDFDRETNNAYLFFDHVSKVLDEIIRLPKDIPTSDIGQFMKLGVKSAKGNLALRVWVDSLFLLWTKQLKRDFNFDGKDGVNGRNRFINFTHDSLSVIHPSLEFSTVENAVTSYLRK